MSFENLFYEFPQGVVYQDSSGKIIYANKAAEKILGLTIEQMQGRTSVDPRWKAVRMDGSDFPGEEHPAMQALQSGKEVKDVIMGIFHPGKNKTVWINVHAVPQFQNNDHKPFQVFTVFVDITKRIEIEKNLNQSELDLSTILDNTNEAIFAVDRNLKVIRANRVFYDFTKNAFGKPLKLGESILSTAYTEEARKQREDYYRRAFCGEKFMANTELVWQDGRVHFFENKFTPIKFDDDDKIKYVVVFTTNITDQVTALEHLKQSEINLSSIIKNTNVGTWRWNVQTGETIFNERWAEIIGYSLQELAPLNIDTWIRFAHPADLKRSDRRLKAHFERRSSMYECESRMKHKNGNWVWVFDTGKVESWTEDGKPLIMSGTHLEITEKKEQQIINELRLSFLDYSQKHNLSNLLLKILNDSERLSGSKVAFYHFVNDDQETIKLQQWSSNTQKVFCKISGLKNMHYNISDAGVWVEAVKVKKPIIHNDFSKVKNTKGLPEGHAPIFRELIIPIIRNQIVVAVMGVGNKDSDYTNQDLDLLHKIADMGWDIIEKKRAQELLVASEERFRNMFQNHTVVQLLIDPVSSFIVDANKAAAEFYGYSVTELKSMRIFDLNIMENHEIENQMMLAKQQHKNYFEFKHRLKNGDIKDVNVYSSKIVEKGKDLLYSIIFDVTEKMALESQLQLLSSAVNQSPVSTYITDSNGIIIYANDSFVQSYGYSRNEIVGRNPKILSSGKQSKEFYTDLWQTILGGKVWRGTIINKSKDEKLCWVDTLISPISSINNELNFIALQLDITDLILAKEKAEESDRLKSAFLATMNHELRTPLNHILGFSDIISDTTGNENVKDYSKLIHESGIDLLTIIEDIFELALAEKTEIKPRMEPFYVRDIYSEIKTQTKLLLHESNKADTIELDCSIDSKLALAQIVSDRSKIITVVTNLTRNAVKFTKKGKISLAFRSMDNDMIQISVKDTGIGIPEEMQQIIFQFFRQIDDSDTREFGGVGIGLAISEKVAEILNGEILVKSKPGKGSEFIFQFPAIFQQLEDDTFREKNKPVLTTNNPDFKRKKILLVEDDELSSDIVSEMLAATNCSIIKAFNGIECLDVFRKNKDIELVIMDIKMPELDGLSTTREIRKTGSTVPIIALTAHSLTKEKQKAKEAGCNDVITKPVKRLALLTKLSEYL